MREEIRYREQNCFCYLLFIYLFFYQALSIFAAVQYFKMLSLKWPLKELQIWVPVGRLDFNIGK